MKNEIGEDIEQYQISAEAVNTDEVNNVLNYSNTFAILDRSGNIHSHDNMVQGIYYEDTRFLNQLDLKINDQKPILLSGNIKEGNSVYSGDLTNPTVEECGLQQNSIHITRHQFVREGTFYERMKIFQYDARNCSFDLTLSFRSDFRDLFEIRGLKRNVVRNKVLKKNHTNYFEFVYMGLDGQKRRTEIHFQTKVPYKLIQNQAIFHIDLSHHKGVVITYNISFIKDEEQAENISFEEAKKLTDTEIIGTQARFTGLKTSNDHFNQWLYQSETDLIALLSKTKDGHYPHAGIPWYNTPFGRDGLVTAIETLWVAPFIAKNVLTFLAKHQAINLNAEKDAEPGKILHEMRNGEMANTGEVPFKKYYGTVDATPLFVLLAGMYFERTGDLPLIKEIWPNIKAAIAWIDQYGDIDKDGFVEYIHKTKDGLSNQGWKDSFDSIMHDNNALADPPIALCEVQSYVYGAKNHAANMALHLGRTGLAKKLKGEAETLKKKFNEQFWDEALNCYVLALDGDKKPCRVISSNAGHTLLTGIADRDKAEKLAAVLTGRDMFSGWGIRTLSMASGSYNPMSYHNGSVWPHDNAIIAYGLSKYGFQTSVLQVMEALFKASLYIDLQRMPELYCGFYRRNGEGPTAYPVACSPQAWSVGAVFLLLQACLCVTIDAHKKTIIFDKVILPEYLNNIHIRNLQLDGQACDLTIKRTNTDVSFNLLKKPPGWEMIIIK